MLLLDLCDVRDWRVRGMKDTEPKVLLSERLVEEPLTEEDLQQALVLGTGDLLRTFHEGWDSANKKITIKAPGIRSLTRTTRI